MSDIVSMKIYSPKGQNLRLFRYWGRKNVLKDGTENFSIKLGKPKKSSFVSGQTTKNGGPLRKNNSSVKLEKKSDKKCAKLSRGGLGPYWSDQNFFAAPLI